MKWQLTAVVLVVLTHISEANAARLLNHQKPTHAIKHKSYQNHHKFQQQQQQLLHHNLKKSIHTAHHSSAAQHIIRPTTTTKHNKMPLQSIQKQQQQRKHQQQQRTDMPPPPPPPAPSPLLPHQQLESLEHSAQLEIDMLQCPAGCVCQQAHFDELAISRWIQHMQARRASGGGDGDGGSGQAQEADEWGYEHGAFSSNEATYEEGVGDGDGDGDSEGLDLTNPFMKQATCILQEETNIDELTEALPHDLHALILLYTSNGQNKSVNLSTLKPLNQLTTLEVRGGLNRSLRIIFDEPLSFLQHANFESVTLLGSDTFKRPKNPIHPKDSFDYKPRGEATYDEVDANRAFAPRDGGSGGDYDNFADDDDDEDDDILPYDIYKQELIKARMPAFYGWEHLEVLRIHGCQLNELQWEMFDGLKALQHLSLERNGIAEVPPFSFYGAMHIETLSLAHNRIRDLHYRALAGLLELQVLDLSDNLLDKLSERSFPPFPKLLRVDFRNNPVRYILPASFWVMNGTRVMDFDSLTVAVQLRNNQPFESLLQLETLYIGNVAIGNLEQNMFKGLTALEKLTLRGKIRAIEFDAFAGLIKLRELELSHCGIQEISMDALIDCKSLEILDLSYNNISYFPPGLLDDLLNLEEIYLQGNQLHTLPVTFFLRPKLRLARLNENPWSCDCDMLNWRPKITNQERGPRTKRCITDYQSGKQISCRRVDSYVYDNRLAPRCATHNERSVFYVLHKQLKCGPGRVVTATTTMKQRIHAHNNNNNNNNNRQRIPHWRKIEEQRDQFRWGPIKAKSPKFVNAMMQENALSYAIKQDVASESKQAAINEANNISNEI